MFNVSVACMMTDMICTRKQLIDRISEGDEGENYCLIVIASNKSIGLASTGDLAFLKDSVEYALFAIEGWDDG